jgi:A/G-specific adenine glycosylase
VPTAPELVPPLLAWFARHARDLPWRRTTDPYAIWISEVMLQQTQVATVIPYWERWLRELPDIASLAAAPPERVLKLWEGLGYYSRARNLQRAAREIVAGHEGRFPREFATVLALPGIGRYTAGAICSLAFNQPTPVLDGNVVRVLARVLGIREDVARTAVRERLWRKAAQLVQTAAATPRRRTQARNRSHHPQRLDTHPCGALNEALMELGALVCTPRAPRCQDCPWSPLCVARTRGLTEVLPRKRSAPRTHARRIQAFVCVHAGRLLVRQRPESGVNRGLWELPNLEAEADAPPLAAARGMFGDAVVDVELAMTLRHAITSSRIRLEVYRVTRAPGRSFPRAAGRWVPERALGNLAFTAAHRRALTRLRLGAGN